MFHCRYCGTRVKLSDLHIDHVTPVAKGGDSFGNLVASCSNCNLSKGTRLWEPSPLRMWQHVLNIVLIVVMDIDYIVDGIKEKAGLWK